MLFINKRLLPFSLVLLSYLIYEVILIKTYDEHFIQYILVLCTFDYIASIKLKDKKNIIDFYVVGAVIFYFCAVLLFFKEKFMLRLIADNYYYSYTLIIVSTLVLMFYIIQDIRDLKYS